MEVVSLKRKGMRRRRGNPEPGGKEKLSLRRRYKGIISTKKDKGSGYYLRYWKSWVRSRSCKKIMLWKLGRNCLGGVVKKSQLGGATSVGGRGR